MPTATTSNNVQERFWSKVKKSDGCWEWQAANASGYGLLIIQRRVVFAHRFSYEQLFGHVPKNVRVGHRCKNRACVRPDHLYLAIRKPPQKILTTVERFWLKVRKTDDCWEWAADRNRYGHGRFWDGKRNTQAHRYSYELLNGPIPAGLNVCHHCDNPPCVRPDHLFVGTQKENIHDAIRKGRVDYHTKNRCGANGARSKLTFKDACEIRKRCVGVYGEKVALAKEYGVERRTIFDILKGARWRGSQEHDSE